VYTNQAPFENPVIPEVLIKNVDEAVDNYQFMWRGCGQLSPLLLPKREKESAAYKLYNKNHRANSDKMLPSEDSSLI